MYERLLPKAITAEELIAMKIDPCVRRDGSGNIEFCKVSPNKRDWNYWIPEIEVETRRGLIRWIGHLCEKNWVTGQHIRELIALSHEVACKKNV